MGNGQGQGIAGLGKRVAAVAGAITLSLSVGVALAEDASAAAGGKQPQQRAKNVIVMISDGWGYNTVAATDYYQHGRTGGQVYERFPVRTSMSTYSYYGGYNPFQAWGLFNYLIQQPTESAAAATTMSTGVKTYDAAIGVDVDRVRLRHIAEEAEQRGKATGVISSVPWSHATPAGFVAHNISRNDYVGIAQEMINDSATDVIMGAGNPSFDDNGTARVPDDARGHHRYVGGKDTWDALLAGTAGGDADGDGEADPWKLIQTKAEFEALAKAKRTPARVVGTAQVATTLQQSRAGDGMAAAYAVPSNTNVPDLKPMTKGALNVLDNDRDGFFLMVEGGAVDWAGHANQPGRIIATSPSQTP